jgi:peptide/nickel transport system permease protein
VRRFALIRTLQSLIGLILLLAVLFFLIRLIGDPALQFLSPDATKEDYQLIRKRLGLDKPLYIQYGLFVISTFKGDLGKSIFTKRPVIDSIKEALPNSLRLALVSALMAFLVAGPLGVMAAVRKGTSLDTFARVIAGLGQSLPSFWVGFLLIELFTVQLGILPASGVGDWTHYMMPASCLALFLMAGPLRLLRSSMLEVFDSEYIKLARIKGVSERVIVWKHALRNALLPVLSYSAMYLAILITGSITTEVVFAWPGIGRLAYRAIINQDFPLIQGVVLIIAVIVIVANLLADILYAYVDPRIRLKV